MSISSPFTRGTYGAWLAPRGFASFHPGRRACGRRLTTLSRPRAEMQNGDTGIQIS